MNIALVHYSAPPVVGGVESVLAHQARLMTDAKHAVKIIAARGDQWDDRIPLIRLPLIDSRHPDVLTIKTELDAGHVPPDFAPLVETIARALRMVLAGVEIVIAHNVCSLNKNLALTAALHRLNSEVHSATLILWHHDLAWTTPRYRPELHDGDPWDLLRTDWPGVKHVVVSEPRRRELANLLGIVPDRIAVVPNGVDPARFLKLEAQTQALVTTLKLADANPLLLLPARLTPHKNVELALRVLAVVRGHFPQARLVVTGPPGPHNPANIAYFGRLKKLRAELGLAAAAHFLTELSGAYLPDDVIADFFRLADALFLPSREEGFGIPLLEAALARLPIFCADIPQLRDLGGEEALYFSPEADPETVAALITTRLEADPVCRFAARARRDYAWEQIYLHHIAPLLRL